MGEGETAAVQVQISALPKVLVADGQMLGLLDWWVWFTAVGGNKDSRRQGEAHMLSW